MGLGTKTCAVFCYLNAVCGVFFGWLFDIGIASMAVTCVRNQWDNAQKGKACRNAGFLYLIVGVLLNVRAVYQDRQERNAAAPPPRSRLTEYGIPDVSPDSVPLLERAAESGAGDLSAAVGVGSGSTMKKRTVYYGATDRV